MGKFFSLLICFLFIYSGIYAQHKPRGDKFGFDPRNKIEQLEKLKLIETLNLDEETSIRFFTRRNKFMDAQHEYMTKRDNVLKEIEKMVTDENNKSDEKTMKAKMEEVFSIEKSMLDERIKFFNSLNDILTIEQIAKAMAFEVRFREEVRNVLMRKQMNPPHME